MAPARSITTYILDDLDADDTEMTRRAAGDSLQEKCDKLQPRGMNEDEALREALRASMQDVNPHTEAYPHIVYNVETTTPSSQVRLSALRFCGTCVDYSIPALLALTVILV